jgi:hypothetical protein
MEALGLLRLSDTAQGNAVQKRIDDALVHGAGAAAVEGRPL